MPVVWLVVRRRSVLARLAEMERTGEHPDNVVHTTTADGQSIDLVDEPQFAELADAIRNGTMADYYDQYKDQPFARR